MLTGLLIRILQYDAFDIGFITTDDFTNADILEATYPALSKRFYDDWAADPAIPIVTGFLGKVFTFLLMMFGTLFLEIGSSVWFSYVSAYFCLKGCKSCAITTLGRGGSDLTATTIGKALGLREIQVELS